MTKQGLHYDGDTHSVDENLDKAYWYVQQSEDSRQEEASSEQLKILR